MSNLIGRRRMMQQALVGVALLAAIIMPLPLPSAEAASPSIDPREIALTPTDLPAGFAVDPAASGVSNLPEGAGVAYRIDMKRPATAEAVAEGPIVVQQIIVRVDPAIPATEMLAAIRDEIVQDGGLSPMKDGPNDGGTVSLKRQDGDVTLYTVGFAKEQMVIFTTTGGLANVTTFPRLVELAGVTSSRLDAALNRP